VSHHYWHKKYADVSSSKDWYVRLLRIERTTHSLEVWFGLFLQLIDIKQLSIISHQNRELIGVSVDSVESGEFCPLSWCLAQKKHVLWQSVGVQIPPSASLFF
jgi:hypothetical protein